MLNEPRGTALKVGPHATRIVEPRQARKGATVRRPSRVPWEYLTGVGSAGRSQYGSIEGGCTVTLVDGQLRPVPSGSRAMLPGPRPEVAAADVRRRSSGRTRSRARCATRWRRGASRTPISSPARAAIGKTTTARLLARALLCPERKGAPSRAASARRAADAAASVDVIEIDARVQPRHRGHPHAARERQVRAGARALQGLHHRRGAPAHRATPSTRSSRRWRSRRRTSSSCWPPPTRATSRPPCSRACSASTFGRSRPTLLAATLEAHPQQGEDRVRGRPRCRRSCAPPRARCATRCRCSTPRSPTATAGWRPRPPPRCSGTTAPAEVRAFARALRRARDDRRAGGDRPRGPRRRGPRARSRATSSSCCAARSCSRPRRPPSWPTCPTPRPTSCARSARRPRSTISSTCCARSSTPTPPCASRRTRASSSRSPPCGRRGGPSRAPLEDDAQARRGGRAAPAPAGGPRPRARPPVPRRRACSPTSSRAGRRGGRERPCAGRRPSPGAASARPRRHAGASAPPGRRTAPSARPRRTPASEDVATGWQRVVEEVMRRSRRSARCWRRRAPDRSGDGELTHRPGRKSLPP